MAFPWSRRDAEADLAPASGRRSRVRGRRIRQAEARRERTQTARDRQRQRLTWSIGTVLIMVIVGILAAGFYDKFYRPPRVWAGSVRDVEFNMGDLVQRIRVLQGFNRYTQGGRVDLSVVPFEYLQGLLHAEILRQASPGLNISVTGQNIDSAIRNLFYPTVPEGQETDQGQLEREFKEDYQTFLTTTNLSDDDFRRIIEERLHLANLYAILGQTIENNQDHVEIQWIRLNLESTVVPQDVRTRLDVEEFAVVANDVSSPGEFEVGDSPGYVGWVPRGAFPFLDPLLFGDEEGESKLLAAGEISDPVLGHDDHLYIVQKLADPENREIADGMRHRVNAELVLKWQDEQLQQGSDDGWLKINFNSSWYSWVADQVAVSAPRVPPTQP